MWTRNANIESLSKQGLMNTQYQIRGTSSTFQTVSGRTEQFSSYSHCFTHAKKKKWRRIKRKMDLVVGNRWQSTINGNIYHFNAHLTISNRTEFIWIHLIPLFGIWISSLIFFLVFVTTGSHLHKAILPICIFHIFCCLSLWFFALVDCLVSRMNERISLFFLVAKNTE